jgi:hypothetical protein
VNLVIVAVSAFLALAAALHAGSPPLAAVVPALSAALPTPVPTPTPAPPTSFDVIGAGGPT